MFGDSRCPAEPNGIAHALRRALIKRSGAGFSDGKRGASGRMFRSDKLAETPSGASSDGFSPLEFVDQTWQSTKQFVEENPLTVGIGIGAVGTLTALLLLRKARKKVPLI